MSDHPVERAAKDAQTVSGAPFPPAHTHSDGPDRPARQVPTEVVPEAEPTDPDQPVPEPTHAVREEER